MVKITLTPIFLLTIDNPEPEWDGLVGFPNNLVHDISLIFRTLTLYYAAPL
jgi:hypothetical protein